MHKCKKSFLNFTFLVQGKIQTIDNQHSFNSKRKHIKCFKKQRKSREGDKKNR